MVHAFSLVHDDLPCMDDDDLRRGRPTTHRKFGEAVALLAGDALMTSAFHTLSVAGKPADVRARQRSVEILALCAGAQGMIRGQVLDMLAEGRRATLLGVQEIHLGKTASLLCAATRLGAIWAGAGRADSRRMMDLGLLLGMAFQARDDVLNATSSARRLGKAARSDAARGKATLPAALGLAGAQACLRAYCDEARTLVDALPARQGLWRDLTDYLELRAH